MPYRNRWLLISLALLLVCPRAQSAPPPIIELRGDGKAIGAEHGKALGEQMIPIDERVAVLTSRFVERKPIVTSLLKRSLSRQGGVIVIQGPPGIGLSRLLQELRGDFVVRGGRPALVRRASLVGKGLPIPSIELDILDPTQKLVLPSKSTM